MTLNRDGEGMKNAKNATDLVLGIRAGLALFERRRDDILRIAYTRDARNDVGDLTRWAASKRLPCEEMLSREIDRLAESAHHEGLVLLTRARKWTSAADLGAALVKSRGCALALDRVRNPYNVGAILRSAAFFGLDAVLLGTPAPDPGLAPMAVRVAEGGAENVSLARTTDLADTLARLRARGVQIVGADGHADRSALGFPFKHPAMLVMGNEREGLGDRVRAQCDAIVSIPGTGAVESLNVAVATGVLIAEMTRGRESRPAR
jgi:TrmH RNA methyltransferase